jgi:CheY-like chemotaxis protein
MADSSIKILVVDDDPSIRMSMSQLLAEIGYAVRSAEDGFSALVELRREVPDILLSDLNMPGMSGFELLSVVRRRFSSIQTIAMSAAFQGDEVPSGVAADAFYQKGSSVKSLLMVIDTLHHADRVQPNRASTASLPVWIQPNGHENSGESYVTIACPECLRTFPQALGGSNRLIRETTCNYCLSLIRFAIVAQAEPFIHQASQLARSEDMTQAISLSQSHP